MAYMSFLSHEQFSPRLFILTEGYSMVHRFTIGVIVGDEKILVIDSGLGMHGQLRRYIEKLVGTDKPILCACTHGHLDHVGSACLLDEAYCSLKDFAPGKNDPFDPIRRYSDVVDFSLESNLVSDYCKEHMIKDNRVTFRDIQDGDIFDLGGVRIEAIAVPGHSDGSMAFYNREENYCFTGDAINTDVHLKRLDAEGFRAYQRTLEGFISRVDEHVTLYPAHLPLPMTIDVAKNLVTICQELASGNIEQDPPAEGIFHSRKNDRSIRGHYVNNTCIVYNRRLLGKTTPPKQEDICYYSHEKWSDRIYTVTINYSTVNRITLMVFIGQEKILVIDSGHGLDNKLRRYIERFAGSDKPMLCAMTHIGIDHGGAASLFDEIYLHENDIAKLPMSRQKRYIDVQPFSNYSTEFAEYSYDNMLEPTYPEQCRKISDGDIFHLGGLDVECIFTPGHSAGHMAFYCAQENVCFTGDAMNVDTHLKSMSRQGMVDYVNMLQSFMNRVRPDTVIFSSHLNRPHAMRVPRNIQAACLEIALGQTYGDPPGEAIQQHIGAFHNPNIKMHYHGNCCVVYNTATL